jgi:thiol-disulfide isomerase/thioredoxin
MARVRWIILIVALLTALVPWTAYGQDRVDNPTWVAQGADGSPQVRFYFFWSKYCPHCLKAHPFIDDLPNRYPWIQLNSYEVSENPANAVRYANMAQSLGQDALGVPAFFWCGQMTTGYGSDATTGEELVRALEACYAPLAARSGVPGGATDGVVTSAAAGAAPVAPVLTLPFLGAMSAESMSLPLFTVVLAGLDAFNPCAFFVLLFLLSLMVHAQSRGRMFLVGAVFILFSGLIYFVFMTAWLNVFLWVGELRLITLVAGLIAIFMAAINIKDYFWFKQGVSLSIPESAKPGLYQRMRNTVRSSNMPALIASTAFLAIAANSYELLCTAGFPMVYTRMLTLHDLSSTAYYGYLAAYNIIYVLPLLAIVVVFSFKFGARKLSEEEGRVLKLLSGTMMLLLGAVLVLVPDLLNQVWTAVVLLVVAISVTALVVWQDRRSHRRPHHRHGPGKLRPH